MEQEHFISGYCRTIDQSRMVAAVTENAQLTEVDCCYESCIHVSGCPIAQEIEKLTKKSNVV